MTALLAAVPRPSARGSRAARCCRSCAARSRLVFMDETTLYAARDPQGIRPLVLGRLERGWVVASETAALDIVGARFVREIEPGELLAIDEHGLRTQRFAEAEPKGCLFEYVYLARPDTRSPAAASTRPASRSAAGWPQEPPVEADLVIPVPESGTPAAVGYAEGSPASRTGRVWSRTPTSAARSSSPARPSASSASGSSSTRCARSSRASGSWWSTTRSCAATPSARWSGCCARPARPRCTCASRRRR